MIDTGTINIETLYNTGLKLLPPKPSGRSIHIEGDEEPKSGVRFVLSPTSTHYDILKFREELNVAQI
jgi:hypothetical protein